MTRMSSLTIVGKKGGPEIQALASTGSEPGQSRERWPSKPQV